MSGIQNILLGTGSGAAAVDPYFYSVTSLLHGDGTNGAQNNTFLDSSTNNFTITRNGNTTQGSFSPFSQTGWGNFFNGPNTGSYLRTPVSTDFQLGTSDFTIEFWAFTTSGASDTTVCQTDSGGSGFFGMLLNYHDATNVTWYATSNGSSWNVINGGVLCTVASIKNTWTHFAYVRNGNTFTAYVNGIAVYTTTSSASIYQSANQFVFGSSFAGSHPSNFGGYLSNFRYVKGTAVYTSNFTPSTTPLTAITNTKLLSCQSNRFIDASASAHTLTIGGSPSVQPFSPFNPTTAYSTSAVGGSGYFDGSGDYLSIANNSAFNLGTNNFCIEGWFYPTTSNATQLVFNKWGTVSDTQSMFQIGRISSTFYAQLKTTGGFVTLSTATWIPNAWNHFAVVRNGSTISAYLNGSRFGTDTSNPTLNSGTETMTIGSKQAQDYFTGYITDCRIVNGSAIYDPTQTSITVPTAPLTAVTNTAFLSANTNAGIFDNAAVADYETVGNAQISTSVKKYGTGSMSFDGTGDYLTIPYNQFMNFGTGDFTIEGWFYLNSFANQYYVLGGTWTTGTSDEWLIQIENNGSLRFLTTANTSFFATSLIKTGTWYHFAASRNAGVIKAYINGTAFATIANTNSIGSTSKVLNIGQQPGGTWPWNGYVDDWRISKGVGRYPYNFTPPTAEFPNIGGTVTLTADPYFDYTTLLLPGNGTNGAQNNTFLDSSTNAFSITRNGNTTQGTFSPFSQTGWGNFFDGSGDFLYPADNAAFAYGTGDFTVECWVYPTSLPGSGSNVIIDQRESTPSGGGFSLEYTTTGRLDIATSSVVLSSSSNLTTNQWQHVAMARSGSTLKLFINGLEVGSVSNSTNLTSQRVTIGAYTSRAAAGSYFPGYISNARLVKGTAVYTANFTPSTTPLTAITNTSLLTCQSNRFVDNSSNAFAITRNGDVSVQAFSPFNPTAAWSAATYGGSGYFDGSGDYLQIANSSAYSLDGDFTIEGWFNGSNYGSTIVFFQLGEAGSSGIEMWVSTASATLRASVAGSTMISSDSMVPSQWTHFALVRSGTGSNNISLYANGKRQAQLSSNNTFTGTANNGIRIGAEYPTATPWNGYLSDIRVLKGTAQYSGTTYTIPTAPLTAVSGTQLLTNFTNAGIYDATSKNDLETVGNAQISTTQSKFGGSSMYFDGSGDQLNGYGVTTNLNLLSGSDFTIEFWMRPDTIAPAASGYSCILGMQHYAGNVGYGVFQVNATISAFFNGATTQVTTGNVLAAEYNRLERRLSICRVFAGCSHHQRHRPLHQQLHPADYGVPDPVR